MAVNSGSRRVMERAGPRYVRTFHLEWEHPLPGTEHGEVEYAVTRDEWAAARVRGAKIDYVPRANTPGMSTHNT